MRTGVAKTRYMGRLAVRDKVRLLRDRKSKNDRAASERSAYMNSQTTSVLESVPVNQKRKP